MMLKVAIFIDPTSLLRNSAARTVKLISCPRSRPRASKLGANVQNYFFFFFFYSLQPTDTVQTSLPSCYGAAEGDEE